MSLFEIKSKVATKRAEAVGAFLNVNSSNPSDYRYQQGIIHGMDIAMGIVEKMLKDEEGQDA